jgi:cephalosporin-C deacetylase-like acetyl esterase
MSAARANNYLRTCLLDRISDLRISGEKMPSIRSFMKFVALLFVLVATPALAPAQAIGDTVAPFLEKPVQPVAVTAYQLQKYMMKHITKPVAPATAEQWTAEAQKLRKHILEDVVFHGWPQEWISSAPRFEQTEVVETGHGYRLRKFRYEVVPGFWNTAVLYEPEKINGRVPAILNLVGHDPLGNLVEYEQKRCINFAKQGMLALSLGWPGFGELDQPENSHDFTGHLELTGSSSLGYFYLMMRRGLDFLAAHPQADSKRLGVTGLSGGGWQTTLLSALDERVSVMVEVAGIGSLETNLTRPTDTQEVEEDATDLMHNFDYPFFIAMRAPRPTLLIHNEQDDCCFLAPLVKPYNYYQNLPFFKLYNAENSLRWHQNIDPGTHNYQLDNRQQAYAFFAEQFHMPPVTSEIPSSSEIFTMQQLAGSLPKDNLTTVGLARKLASRINRGEIPADGSARDAWARSQREQLKSVIRYSPLTVDGAWKLISTKRPGIQAFTYRFDFSNSLSATGIWVAAREVGEDAPLTIVLHDKGFKAAAVNVAQRVNRGEQVIALEPLFFGSTTPDDTDPAYWEMLVAGSGDRPLGIEVSQLVAVAKSFRAHTGANKVRLETEGIRSQVVALAAAAIEPDLFSEVYSNDVMTRLAYLLDTPVPYRNAPDLFCLDLYKYFEIDRLAVLASPVKITSGSKAGPLPAPTAH